MNFKNRAVKAALLLWMWGMLLLYVIAAMPDSLLMRISAVIPFLLQAHYAVLSFFYSPTAF